MCYYTGMDNYRNYKHYDDSTDIFCTKCGTLLHDIPIFAEGTEYEREVELCKKHFNDLVGEVSFAIL